MLITRRNLLLVLGALILVVPINTPAKELPADEEIQTLLESVQAEVLNARSGSLPDYIPALQKVNPEVFSLTVVTPDGRSFGVGDREQPFVIMSAAKPFTAALILKQQGGDILRQRIGLEPTGEAFNSINVIEENPRRSVNPLVNAGAMATVSLLAGDDPVAQWEGLLDWYSTLAHAPLALDERVYASVRDTGLRNQSMAALLRSYGRLYGEPEVVRDIYNRQSSVLVTTDQLAMMGAVLAAGGVHPVTGERLLAAKQVTGILALMTMAGMYDGAGAWAWDVGLPAKSGVGGGIVAVVPGRLAIAAFSPRLDERGNSVRAQAAIRAVSARLGLGLFGPVEGAP